MPDPSQVAVRFAVAAWLAPVALGIAPTAGSAQTPHPRFDLAGGVTWLDSTEIVKAPAPGWAVGGTWHFNDRLGLALEVSRNTQSDALTFLVVRADFLSVLAGPKVTTRFGRVRPFGRVLGGVTSLHIAATSNVPPTSGASVDETHGTLQGGGGVDVPISDRLAGRVAYDYRRVFAAESFDQHRIALLAVVGL